MKIIRITAIVVIVFCFCLPCAYARETEVGIKMIPSRPDPEAGPTHVEVGIWILDIDNIDSVSQNFAANVFIILKWKDSRLAHGFNDLKRFSLHDIWNPQMQIANESGIIRKTLPDIVNVEGDGTVTYRQRYVGPFSQPMMLTDFPFDTHVFGIHLVCIGSLPSEIQFAPVSDFVATGLVDAAGFAEKLSLPDWHVIDHNVKSFPYVVAPRKEIAGYHFEFTAKRDSKHFIFKVIFPLILIVMMSWMVFWIDPKNFGTQISVAITSMLTLIAYRFAVDALIPKVPYMTRLDTFIFASTILVFLSLIEVNITGQLSLDGKNALAKKLDRVSRIIFPLAFVISVILTLGLIF